VQPGKQHGEPATLKKRAIIDIDNTLWQFSDPFYLELKKVNDRFPMPDRWCTYNIWEGYCSAEDFIAAINRIHHNQDSDQYEPYPESRDFLLSLREAGFHITLASHRMQDTAPPTERWLARHRLPYDQLHLSLDKTVLFQNVDLVVDDSPLTLEKAVESGALGAGLMFPSNGSYPSNGFRLFQNLHEVREYILQSSSSKQPEIK
jgi:FMN phosphatase YigB (HAD superfamily)